MIRRKIDIVWNYVVTSRNLAAHRRRPFSAVLFRVLAARVFYGMGPDVYDRRRFEEKRLCQAKEYLALWEREKLQRSLCPTDARRLVEDKLRFHEACRQAGLPTPALCGVYARGDDTPPQGIPLVRTKAELRKFLDALPRGRYVAKPIDGGHGRGVVIFDLAEGGFRGLEDRVKDFDRFFGLLKDRKCSSVGYLIQEFVCPHPQLKSVMPGPGLGTFRVVTFLVGEDEVRIPFAVLKIPVGDSVTDNFDTGYSGNWVCPVDVETGTLGNAVGKTVSVRVFAEIDMRPDTGAVFRHVTAPLWREVRATVTRSARAFSPLRTIGWDIAVTKDGPIIIEANWDWGDNIIEVAHGRGLRKELTELTMKSLHSRTGLRRVGRG